jgi:hypothetical protein
VYLLTVPGLTACKDARLFDASSCPSIPPLTFYKGCSRCYLKPLVKINLYYQ